MNYLGKSLDGFSYAMKGLLDIHSVDVDRVPDPDCLSFRAFSFLMDGEASQWFQTAFRWNCYMENFCRNMGLEEQLKVCEARDFFENKRNYDSWFLLGEVRGLESIQTIRTSLYHATKDFYLCKRFDSKKMILCNPMGSPYRILDHEIIKEKVVDSEGFVARFEGEHGCEIRIAAPNSVAKQMLNWRREHPEFLIRNQLTKATEQYTGFGKEIYSIQYAIMHFKIQSRKAMEYFYQFEMIDESLCQELVDRLNGLSLVGKKDDLRRFEEIEEMLWNGLEKTVTW